MSSKLLIGFLAAGLLAACGDSSEPTPNQTPDASQPAEGQDAAYQDPGLAVDGGPAYPAQPYGTEPGDIIKDLSFYGYRTDLSPTAPWNTIKLSDFYDPAGNRGIDGAPMKAMWINVAALWCSACKAEAPVMLKKCQDNRANGLKCFTIIYENATYGPSVRSDVNEWKTEFGIDYAIVNDASFKMGEYFDRAATPLNMFIDLRTMKIAYKFTGFSEQSADSAIADLLK